MNGIISSIHFSPIKSLSFTNIESCEIKKNLGILNDRKFAFSRVIDAEKALLIEKNIPRCTAINLKPEADISDTNLLSLLKKSYDHFDMSVYLRSVDEGKIEVGNILEC